jgi:15-cis-phytoene synthase
MGLPLALVRPSADRSPFAGVIQRKARSFAFAARFLDPERRRATEILYAFFRTVDDLVDERPPGADPAPILAELEGWDAWLREPSRRRDGADPLRAALAETLEVYAIPADYLQALLRGLHEDLEQRPIRCFEDLERYSFRVAASVGLAMCRVLGATSPRALMAAASLGIGMQLTNILRDVGDDLARGRVYLPADEIERFGSGRALASRSVDDGLRALLRFQVERARRYYGAGRAGIVELSPEARYPIALAAELYSRILAKIEARGYDVFSHRAVVTRREKVVLASRLALRMRIERHQRDWGTTRFAPARTEPAGCLGPGALDELAACGIAVAPLPLREGAGSGDTARTAPRRGLSR